MHCENSMGCLFELSNGYKVAYSGDRNSSDNSFIDFIGKDIDLLIHESTYYNTDSDKAMNWNHSTFEKALETGEKANAKYILLCHFSQRYNRKIFSPLPENCICGFEYLSFSFDKCKEICEACKNNSDES